MDAGDIQGRLAFFLAFFAVLAIITARYSWRNGRMAFWVNAIGTSAADVPFFLFLVAPGYVGPPASCAGPVVWILALIFASLGRRAA